MLNAMLHAATAPVAKSIAVAGLALGLGVVAASSAPTSVTHRLSLHAIDQPNAIYISVFRGGDVEATFPDAGLHAFRVETHARLSDGCRWIGIERFEPRADGRSFDYDYSERVASCEPGATPYAKTPRRGRVTIVD